MSKEDVINYVMNSPANTNKAVLEGLLENNSNDENMGYICFNNGYTTTVTVSDPSQYAVLYNGYGLVTQDLYLSVNDGKWYDVAYDKEQGLWEWSDNDTTFRIQSYPDEGTVFFASKSGDYSISLQGCYIFVTGDFTNAVIETVLTTGFLPSQGSSEQVIYIDVTDGAISSDDYGIITPSVEDGKIVALRKYISGTSVNYIVYYYCQAEWQNNNPMQGVTGHIFSNGYKTVRVDAFTCAVTEITN